MKNRKRILIGKIGLDGHDNGIRGVSKWLADVDFEVIYLWLYRVPLRELAGKSSRGMWISLGTAFCEEEHLFYCKKRVNVKGLI